MGFWSTIGSATKGVANSIEKMNQESLELSEAYRNKENEFLIRTLKTGSMTEKMAASKILKERDHFKK